MVPGTIYSQGLGEALAGFADQRDGLGEDHPYGVANRVGLLAGRAGELHPADRRELGRGFGETAVARMRAAPDISSINYEIGSRAML